MRSEICPENSPETWPEISRGFARNVARKCARNFSRNLSRNSPPKFLSLFFKGFGVPENLPPPQIPHQPSRPTSANSPPQNGKRCAQPWPFSPVRAKRDELLRTWQRIQDGSKSACLRTALDRQGVASTDSGSSKQARSFRHRYPDSGVSESEQYTWTPDQIRTGPALCPQQSSTLPSQRKQTWRNLTSQ